MVLVLFIFFLICLLIMFFVPESHFNLLSFSHITCSFDCIISFTKDSVRLQDRISGRIIGTECESYGLYYLRTTTHVGTVMDSPFLLHAQLGHPSFAKMQQLVPSLSKLSNLFVKSCHLRKQSRNLFSRNVWQHASSPFVLVHLDIWGPSRVKSNLGFQYFVTFIYDFSRCTWLFLMKSCCVIFYISIIFNEIKNQFGVSIGILRNDNSCEYLSHSFNTFSKSGWT